MFSILLAILVLCFIFKHWYSRRRLRELASQLPGPPTVPIFGNALSFLGQSRQIFKNSTRLINIWAPCFRVWLGPFLFVALSDPQDVEIVLRNTKYFDKGSTYNFLKSWLGNGLLTATGGHWYEHRKLITPTFHFKILEQFVPIFGANSKILVRRLKEKVGSDSINIAEYLELYSLDTICETAMGYNPNGQTNQENPYVEATKRVSEIVHKRMVKSWLHNELIFSMTSMSQQLKNSLKIIHGTSYEIVKRKQEELKSIKTKDSLEYYTDVKKKKMAFLDHLLLNSTDNNKLTLQDIREEVDTFLFTGHDTTTSLLSFALFLLGLHPKEQDEAYKEIRRVLGDSDREITFQDLSKLKYIERCILETLRMYPTVAALSRTCSKETKLKEHILPSGCTIIILIMKMHSNPEYFPKPKTFDPDRFLPENMLGRHPYSFIPFGAGPRNCIGQKYGMLQAKFILATILQNFIVTAGCTPEELTPVTHIVTKSANGIPIKLSSRNKSNNE